MAAPSRRRANSEPEKPPRLGAVHILRILAPKRGRPYFLAGSRAAGGRVRRFRLGAVHNPAHFRRKLQVGAVLSCPPAGWAGHGIWRLLAALGGSCCSGLSREPQWRVSRVEDPPLYLLLVLLLLLVVLSLIHI